MEDELGKACSMQGSDMHTGVWYENLKKRNDCKDLDIVGRIFI
jgi:hypothetical protein